MRPSVRSMATKRKRGVSWEYTVRRKGLLDKPLYFTFDKEVEGDTYVARLEAMLDKGVVPAELIKKQAALTVADLVAAYRRTVTVAPSRGPYFDVVVKNWGETFLATIDYAWCEKAVDGLKEKRLTPIYIGGLVRVLSQAIDWALRKGYSTELTTNPIKLLPKGFAQYVDREVENLPRDRRLEPGEYEKIIALLEGDRRLMFVLAVETAMRLSEIYSLDAYQVDLGKRTVFLERTKNGDSRQVPLSSVAVAALQGFKGFGYGMVSTKTTSTLSQYFARVLKKAGCVGLHFHDLRAEATCRLFERTRLSDMQIARITGHRDPKVLMKYARLRGSDLAEALW